MTKKMIKIIDDLPGKRLGLFFLMIILAGLAVYISALNLAVWEGFGKRRLEKNSKILRQEIQAREESFISSLNSFYETNAAGFASSNKNPAQFVSRRANVARAGGFTQ